MKRTQLHVALDLLPSGCEVFAVTDPQGPSDTHTGVSLICVHRGHGRVVWTEGLRHDYRVTLSDRWHSAIPAIAALLSEVQS